MKIAHMTTSDGHCVMSYCCLAKEGALILRQWRDMPKGYRACARCVRKLHGMSIIATIPNYMIPRNP